MSNEIAPFGATNGDVTIPSGLGSTGGDLIREAASLWGTSYQLAQAICKTSIVPAHFRGKPDECAAAMVYGATLGLDPIGALKGLYNVHGSVSMYARLMVSLVLRDGHDVWTVESSPQAVTVHGRRKGWPADRPDESSTWTIDRADKAGYTSNAKYKTDPEAMLYAKAASEVCRKIAPDSLNGIYSVEEMQLEARIESAPQNPRPQVTAAAFKPATPDPVEDPAPVGVDVATGEVTDDAPAAAAVDAMFRAFAPAGFVSDARTSEGKEQRIAYMSQILGREVAATRDLTASDVEAVTAALAADAADNDGGEAT